MRNSSIDSSAQSSAFSVLRQVNTSRSPGEQKVSQEVDGMSGHWQCVCKQWDIVAEAVASGTSLSPYPWTDVGHTAVTRLLAQCLTGQMSVMIFLLVYSDFIVTEQSDIALTIHIGAKVT